MAVIVQAVFEKAAHVHAEGLGCAGLPIVSYPHPAPGSVVGLEVLTALAAGIMRKSEELITKGGRT